MGHQIKSMMDDKNFFSKTLFESEILSKGPSGLNRHWDLCEKFDFCARANLPLLHVTYTCTLDLPRIVGLKVLR